MRLEIENSSARGDSDNGNFRVHATAVASCGCATAQSVNRILKVILDSAKSEQILFQNFQ